MAKDFESAFADFIDRREYDQAEAALFSMIRLSFQAGWLAAGGNAPRARPVVELVSRGAELPDLVITDTYFDGE